MKGCKDKSIYYTHTKINSTGAEIRPSSVITTEDMEHGRVSAPSVVMCCVARSPALLPKVFGTQMLTMFSLIDNIKDMLKSWKDMRRTTGVAIDWVGVTNIIQGRCQRFHSRETKA